MDTVHGLIDTLEKGQMQFAVDFLPNGTGYLCG
nr:MAG TPA: hypothetical protein [Caudoviricetes sp.]